VLKVKDRMVELLHADMARQTLVVADKIDRCATQNLQTT
jgi:hypothetical protein